MRTMGSCCWIALGLLITVTCSSQASDTAQSEGTKPAAASNPVPDKDTYCADALETFLPGDYYACEARAYLGRGKSQQAIELLQESASWANKAAQYLLGLAYFNGDLQGVPQNRPLGIAWLALAAERKNQTYQLAYAIARAKASADEIREASALWRQMRKKYGDSVAAPRAIRRFNHAIAPIDEATLYNGTIYLHGLSPYPMSAYSVAKTLHHEADADFDDWRGTVVVGNPQWIH